MNAIAKFLLITGAVLVALGLIWHLGATYLNFGRLPGDVDIRGKNFRFYFPIVTCIILSVVVSLLISLFQFFRR